MQLHRITVARAAEYGPAYQFARVLVLSQDRERALLAVARQAAGLVGGDPAQTFVIHDGEVDPDAVVAVEQGRGLLPPFHDSTPTVAQLLAQPAPTAKLTPEQSNPQNNPNHPRIRCVDGQDPAGNWTSADDKMQPVTPPYRVFDILNQEHVGPEFLTREKAVAYLVELGGPYAPTATPTKTAWVVIYRDDLGRQRGFECQAADGEEAIGLCRDEFPFADVICSLEHQDLAPTATTVLSCDERHPGNGECGECGAGPNDHCKRHPDYPATVAAPAGHTETWGEAVAGLSGEPAPTTAQRVQDAFFGVIAPSAPAPALDTFLGAAEQAGVTHWTPELTAAVAERAAAPAFNEPWRVDDSHDPMMMWGDHRLVFNASQNADGRRKVMERIVACVNACSGVEVLAPGLFRILLGKLKALTGQRDTLRGALMEAEDYLKRIRREELDGSEPELGRLLESLERLIGRPT